MFCTPAIRTIPGKPNKTKWLLAVGFVLKTAVCGFRTSPDLGVELDYDQLERLKERYKKLPFRKRDDEAEMRQHVDPNWKRVLPRW